MKRTILALIMVAALAAFPVLAQADNGGSQGNGQNGSQQNGGNSQEMGNGSHDGGRNGDMDGGEAWQKGKDSEESGQQGFGKDDDSHGEQGYGYKVGSFVDEDGDGFNDLAPDEDGDGIPNGLDPDYQTPRDGTGNQFGKGRADGEESLTGYRAWFAFLLAPMTSLPGTMEGFGPHGESKGTQSAFGNGPGNGSGFGEDAPGSGSGFGPGGTTGDCDGSGPNRPDSNNDNGRNQQGGRL